MDNKNDKKKESIEDILSDLNGLLNKMPSILDGIKMPEIKPVEFEKADPAPLSGFPQAEENQPVAPNPPLNEAPAFDGDKTMIIDSLSNLPEGASVPLPASEESRPWAPDNFIAEEAAVPGKKEPAPELSGAKLMGSPLEPPGTREKADSPQPASLYISPLTPPQNTSVEPAAGAAPASLEFQAAEEDFFFSQPGESLKTGSAEPENLSGLPVAGLTRASDSFADFAIPDIDALMQLSEGNQPEGPGALPSPAAEPALTVPETENPNNDDLLDFEQKLANAAPEEMAMDLSKSSDEGREPSQFPELPETAPADNEAALQPEAAFVVENISPAIEAPAPAPAQDAVPSAQPEFGVPLPDISLQETLNVPPEQVNTIEREPSAGVSVPDIGLSVPPSDTQTAQPPPAQELPPEAEPLLTVGNAQDVPSAALPPSADADKTMVINAHSAGDGDAEKTVIFQSSAMPDSAVNVSVSDLAGLAAKGVPGGIPAERIRSLMFLYASEDGGLCAKLLADIDAVCQRSQTAPMFVKRAGVNVFDSDMNANFVHQMVVDSGAAGMVCVGAIPQEKVYEIENVFTSAGVYFKHFDSESFSHSAVLDLLLEIILR